MPRMDPRPNARGSTERRASFPPVSPALLLLVLLFRPAAALSVGPPSGGTTSPGTDRPGGSADPGRRRLLLSLAGGLCSPAALAPKPAVAGIDVSGLSVKANPLDELLGGTYYEDVPEREGIDGRIGRRKYTILEDAGEGLLGAPRKKKKPSDSDMFKGLSERAVIVRGESTAISSSRDDSLELTGRIFLCDDQEDPSLKSTAEGCISIDFSPVGGSPDTRGYWDAKEHGIRFVDSQAVWSKQ